MELKMFSAGSDPECYEWIIAENKEQVLECMKKMIGVDTIEQEYEEWKHENKDGDLSFEAFVDDYISELDSEKDFPFTDDNSQTVIKKVKMWIAENQLETPYWFATACN